MNPSPLCYFRSKPQGWCGFLNKPLGNLIADGLGNLYGTTQMGGASGQGVVFKVEPDGTQTVLHHLTGNEGQGPWAGLITDHVGNL
jgi:uncharacterized repeat protein (TIGR03803 family)